MPETGGGLTVLAVLGILVALALVIAGAAYFLGWRRARREDEARTLRPPTTRPPTPRDSP